MAACRLISWTTASVLGGAVPFDVCSASPLLRTSHLQRNVNRNAGLDVAVCFTRLSSSITPDPYRHSGRIGGGIGGDTKTDISY